MDNKRGNKQNSYKHADFEVLQESVLGLALVFGLAFDNWYKVSLKALNEVLFDHWFSMNVFLLDRPLA